MLSLFSEVTKTAVSWCIHCHYFVQRSTTNGNQHFLHRDFAQLFAVELMNFLCPKRHFSKLPSELKRFKLWYQDVDSTIDVYTVHMKFTYKQIQLYSVLKSGKP